MGSNGISFSGSILYIPAVPSTTFPLHSITWIQAAGSGAGRRLPPSKSQEQAE